MASMKKVFLSSTARDLHEHREAAYRAIEGLDGWHCVRMEDFGARDWEADDFCRAKVTECDVFVGIVGHCYGSCPPDSDKSYTLREFEAAVDAKKPRLMFVAPKDFPLPADLVESDEKRERQREFRERASLGRIRDTFSSADDLARRVVQAIGNWEREQATAAGKREGDRAADVLPRRPQPYFVHPYPLQEHFTGRAAERQMLTEWLTGGRRPLLAMVAMGGMGKSALTWAWVQRDVLGFPLPGSPDDPTEVAQACRVPEGDRPEGVFWWSFYDAEAHFAAFVEHALTYAGVDPATVPSATDKVRALIGQLQERRVLLVLDGFERELRAYASLNAAYQGDVVTKDERGDFRSCVDRHAETFLQGVASRALRGRVLLTSRLFPRELDGLAGCRREDLVKMAPEDAVAFFHAHGVKGTRAEIEEVSQPYGYHPLSLRLLAGVIARDKRTPGDIQAARRHPVLADLKGKEQHHILQVAYDELDDEKRTLVSRLAAFRNPMTYESTAIFDPHGETDTFDAALEELIERGLLLFDKEQNCYDLHPIVRQYAYDRLGDKEGVHSRLRDYFAEVPTPGAWQVETLEDLAPVIELYHHTVRAGWYDEACELYYYRLRSGLYYRFGAYQICIELLRLLFPDGEDRQPRLKAKNFQGWALSSLANSYALGGRARRAILLFERHNSICVDEGDALNLSIGLANLAHAAHLRLGELSLAERNLRRAIGLCRETGEELYEAIAQQELGQLLAYRSAGDEAVQELDASLAYFSAHGNQLRECIGRSYRSLCNLLAGSGAAALHAAQGALRLWEDAAKIGFLSERDRVRVEWLLGAALVALAGEEPGRREELLPEAEEHLTTALTRCRRINVVYDEPDVLLAWGKWQHAKGNGEQAKKDAEEALGIADRCEYRLNQADIHNFLGRLALERGDREAAREHAETGKERAWCDGPPHCYRPALDEAERLLEEINRGER